MSLKTFENIAMNTGKQFISLYALDMTGIANMANDSSTIKRNLKRGLIWYLSNEAIEQVVVGHSNLTIMDPKVLIDDVFFNAVASLGIEQLNLYEPVYNVVSQFGAGGKMAETLATALIIEGVNLAGEQLSTSIVKNISNKLGF